MANLVTISIIGFNSLELERRPYILVSYQLHPPHRTMVTN